MGGNGIINNDVLYILYKSIKQDFLKELSRRDLVQQRI